MKLVTSYTLRNCLAWPTSAEQHLLHLWEESLEKKNLWLGNKRNIVLASPGFSPATTSKKAARVRCVWREVEFARVWGSMPPFLLVDWHIYIHNICILSCCSELWTHVCEQSVEVLNWFNNTSDSLCGLLWHVLTEYLPELVFLGSPTPPFSGNGKKHRIDLAHRLKLHTFIIFRWTMISTHFLKEILINVEWFSVSTSDVGKSFSAFNMNMFGEVSVVTRVTVLYGSFPDSNQNESQDPDGK